MPTAAETVPAPTNDQPKIVLIVRDDDGAGLGGALSRVMSGVGGAGGGVGGLREGSRPRSRWTEACCRPTSTTEEDPLVYPLARSSTTTDP